MFLPDSPYYTSLSTPAIVISVSILTVITNGHLGIIFHFVRIVSVFCTTCVRIITCHRSELPTLQIPIRADSDSSNEIMHQPIWYPFKSFVFIWRSLTPWRYGMWNTVAKKIILRRSSEIDSGILH